MGETKVLIFGCSDDEYKSRWDDQRMELGGHGRRSVGTGTCVSKTSLEICTWSYFYPTWGPESNDEKE